MKVECLTGLLIRVIQKLGGECDELDLFLGFVAARSAVDDTCIFINFKSQTMLGFRAVFVITQKDL